MAPTQVERPQTVIPETVPAVKPKFSSDINGEIVDAKIGESIAPGKIACVLGIGTANPERVVYQTDFAKDFITTLNSSERVQTLTNKISTS